MVSACVSLEPCALRVLDDAMAPDVPAGAVVIVDPGEPAGDGSLVVLEHEGEVLLRRLRIGPAEGGAGAGVRCVAPAGPEILLDEGWRGALRGVVTSVRAPRRRGAANASRVRGEPEPHRGPRGRAAARA